MKKLVLTFALSVEAQPQPRPRASTSNSVAAWPGASKAAGTEIEAVIAAGTVACAVAGIGT